MKIIMYIHVFLYQPGKISYENKQNISHFNRKILIYYAYNSLVEEKLRSGTKLAQAIYL